MESPAELNTRTRMLVLCPYPVGVAPSQRLKYEQYFESFRRAGYLVEVSPFFSLSGYKNLYRRGKLLSKALATLLGYLRRLRDLARVGSYDVVYVHLWVTPLGPPLFEAWLRKLAPHIVYDLDDMIALAPASPSHRWVSRLKGRGKMSFLMKVAREVIVCTPALEELARRVNSRVTDISSTINTVTYVPVNRYENLGEITLGWSGSHSTSPYLRLLQSVLCRLAARYPLRLLVMGDANFSLPGVKCESREWSEASEVPTLQEMDIGLYPLPIDDPWVLGKSGLKALQYMALGIPPVATAVGANYRVIEDGVSGFLVATEEEWVDRLSRLIEDCELRRRLGQAARARVVEQFSVAANEKRYLEVLRAARRPR